LTNKSKEIQAPNKLCTMSTANRFSMYTVQLDLVEGGSKEIDEMQEDLREENANVQELSQQLKQVQQSISELYQENRELRR